MVVVVSFVSACTGVVPVPVEYSLLITLQRTTSLRRRAQANSPAASYWLRRVKYDGGHRDWTSPLCRPKGCRESGLGFSRQKPVSTRREV